MLEQPYERWKLRWGEQAFEASIGGNTWLDFSPYVETETAIMQHFSWSNNVTGQRYDIMIGVAPRAKVLGWSVPDAH